EGCRTPTQEECQIPAARMCPPPPRKKICERLRKDPPENGYFQSLELDAFFRAIPPQ
ncbi:hypothetical protein M569_12095, partial [Genlisea aurea]